MIVLTICDHARWSFTRTFPALKVVAVAYKKSETWSLTREFLKQYQGEKEDGYLLSGRLREVVAMREFTVLSGYPVLVRTNS